MAIILYVLVVRQNVNKGLKEFIKNLDDDMDLVVEGIVKVKYFI